MSNNLKKILALLLACMMCATLFAGCKETEEPINDDPVIDDQPQEQKEPENTTPLVVGYDDFNEKFSPFYSQTVPDSHAVQMTQIQMMTTDRMGGIIYNAIEGETVNYNGTDYTYTGPCDLSVDYDEAADITTYTVKLREDLVFSDGEPVTADDMLFTYYVYMDPAYVGSTTLSSYDIIGLVNYQTQTNDDMYAKYSKIFADIVAAGREYTLKGNESFTQEQYDLFWNECLEEAWREDVQSIIDYIVSADKANFEKNMPEGFEWSDNIEVAYSMKQWNFGAFEVEKDAEGNVVKDADDNPVYAKDTNGNYIFKSYISEKTWDLVNTFPTFDDFYEDCKAAYENDPNNYWKAEHQPDDTVSVMAAVEPLFIRSASATDPDTQGPINSVTGVNKLDEYTIEIKTKSFSAPAVYTLCGLQIAPLHYYGDEAQWDPDNGLYGHAFNDLKSIQQKTSQPMGAGPYKFVKFENKVIYFEANENYYKGTPKTKYLQFKETTDSEMVAAIASGTIDCGEMNGSVDRYAEVRGYNSNGEITGDVIVTSQVDNQGYGYIGISATHVMVGNDKSSEASKCLRKAIATIIAVYRDSAYDSYYADAASVIQYPISNTSWAAPQPTDSDYKAAFSVDVNGNEIYTSDMNADQRYAAAKQAALGYFEAAGYTVENGKLTAAPEGAKMSYEMSVPGDGIGDHPSFAVVTDTKAALAELGLEIRIDDPSSAQVMFDRMSADELDMWCAAWQSSIDPDMYQVYHSSGIVGRGGSDSNHYSIEDAELDQLIVDARKSDDQAYRKAIYKQCLDLIVDYAVEIPAYQRQNSVIFSNERMIMDTVTPDITTYWNWFEDIQNVEMH